MEFKYFPSLWYPIEKTYVCDENVLYSVIMGFELFPIYLPNFTNLV